eukprot:Protomagalhaensia_sp_Gyna_25__896@NODE_1430_length_1843_cov_223_133038_g1154_i0_p1_GENE_NODE_1430_length_1843_cov_223_133038_g1154_i0NODE_1430_length_1843_cov_223_133038_g1154_i0_p1_ORF_typecomplete_len210_score54_43Cwf_Cwc_15/PF04889_12/3_8e37Na_trans_assoc/PF06512_13/0_0079YL1/PF05764_13/0_072Sigma70_ner/PF04546_13/0_2DUF3381/PF11861_8/0_23GvpL_GvpF/PF06386_11/0_28Lin8/PF03353_15/0_33SDA1/PF05285_12/0_43Herpes_LMP1/PF05297_11/1_5DNA_pol_phi/PF04931_13/2_3Astro_capsid_p/PF12226_8/4_3TFIIF_alpha
MSTSHRPTFYPAVGGTSQGGNLATIPTSRVSARDLPSQGTLKRRRLVEPNIASGKNAISTTSSVIDKAPSLASLIQLDEKLAAYAGQDRDIDIKSEGEFDSSESDDDDDEKVKEEEEDDDSSSEDEEIQLQRELEALKREREEARIKAESKTLLEKVAENIAETKVGKSWEDEAVFKVNVKEVRNEKPRFINDSVRSQFHSRFLRKYIQ